MNQEENNINTSFKHAMRQFRKGILVDFDKASYTPLSCFIVRLEDALAE